MKLGMVGLGKMGASMAGRLLEAAVHAVFEERQVYRIDHYLGKETARNVLFFRKIMDPMINIGMMDDAWRRSRSEAGRAEGCALSTTG